MLPKNFVSLNGTNIWQYMYKCHFEKEIRIYSLTPTQRSTISFGNTGQIWDEMKYQLMTNYCQIWHSYIRLDVLLRHAFLSVQILYCITVAFTVVLMAIFQNAAYWERSNLAASVLLVVLYG